MSIWTDLLLLDGHAATPRGARSLAPELFAKRAQRESAEATEAEAAKRDDRAPTRDDGLREGPQPQLVPRATDEPRQLARAVALPKANRISPNDLW